MLRNEDYELNWRLRERGETVWFDPRLVLEYRPRGSLRALARQYFEYGRWKRVMLARHPRSMRLRQLAAPALLAALAASALLAAAAGVTAAGGLPAAVPLAYALFLLGGAAVIGVRRRRLEAALVPVVAATIHVCWGLGFFVGVSGRRTRAGALMAGLRVPAGALRWAVLAGIALLFATPFVVTPGTLFPFVVGKAVWTRSIIEIVFALWAVLALARPEYRPPRSWLLLLLGAGVAVALLAAGFGVSVQRSLWSNYERMQGVVDLAHWAALAVVLASVLRTGAEWRALLAVNAGASTALACLVVAGHFQLDVPFFGALPEPHRPRMGGPIGNPTYLAVCMLFNLVVAAGFAARAWLPAAAPAAAPAPLPKGGGRRRRRHAPAQPTGRRRRRWIGGPAWTAVAALHLWVLGLAGSVGGFVGLFAGIAFAAVSSVLLGRGAGRRRAVAALALLAAAAVGAGVRFVAAERPAASRFERPLVRYVATVHLLRPGVQGRLAAWETGVEGFARRPLLGWGPENFDTVFGRFASGYGAVAQPHDHAHGKLVEVAATSGALGVAAYLALWSWTFLVVWRAARGLERRERALAVGAGAALAGGLVQSQFLFDTAVGSLQTIVLLGFVAHLEAIALPAARRPRLPAPLSGAWAGLLRRRGARVVLGAAAVAVAAGGLATQQAIYAAAHLRHLPAAVLADAGARLGSDAAGSLRVMTGGIDGFPAPCQHLPVVAVRHARPALAAAAGRGCRRRRAAAGVGRA